jgi:hypothetical protein
MSAEPHRLWPNVRWILWAEWDPIGCGVPEDEYDCYISPEVGEIINRVGVEAIADYLDWAANVNMACHRPHAITASPSPASSPTPGFRNDR